MQRFLHHVSYDVMAKRPLYQPELLFAIIHRSILCLHHSWVQVLIGLKGFYDYMRLWLNKVKENE